MRAPTNVRLTMQTRSDASLTSLPEMTYPTNTPQDEKTRSHDEARDGMHRTSRSATASSPTEAWRRRGLIDRVHGLGSLLVLTLFKAGCILRSS